MVRTKDLHEQMQDELMAVVHKVEGGELSYLDGLLRLRENKKPLEDSLGIIKEFEDNYLNDIENEASKYQGKYQGYEIRAVSGRKTFSFKGIEAVEAAESTLKEMKDKYQSAFEGFQKGIIQTAPLTGEPDSPLGWVDEDSEVLPFPTLSISKSYVTVKPIKSNKS